MSISEMGEKSSQIGTQTQIEIAGLEVIQYQNNNHGNIIILGIIH